MYLCNTLCLEDTIDMMNKYPEFYEKFANRHIMYNEQIRHLKELEDQKIAEVIRPSKHIKISKTEKDPAKLERLYQLGVHDAKQFFTSCS